MTASGLPGTAHMRASLAKTSIQICACTCTVLLSVGCAWNHVYYDRTAKRLREEVNALSLKEVQGAVKVRGDVNKDDDNCRCDQQETVLLLSIGSRQALVMWETGTSRA